MFAVYVNKASEGLNDIYLVNNAGVRLVAKPLGQPSYTQGSTISYEASVPTDVVLQHVQALSNVCSSLNTGDNSSSACSNDVIVNVAAANSGILDVEPAYVNFTTAQTQIVTLTNTGNGTLSGLTIPNFSSLSQYFSIESNGCADVTSLAAATPTTPAGSCQIVVSYNPAANVSGGITPIFSYDDDNNPLTPNRNTQITMNYNNGGTTPSSTLNLSPTSISLSPLAHRQIITLTNLPTLGTAGALLTNLQAILPSPLTVYSTTCTNSLAVNTSCTYTVDYSVGSQAGRGSIDFNYDNTQTRSVAADWTNWPVPVGIIIASPANITLGGIESKGIIQLKNDGNAVAILGALPNLPESIMFVSNLGNCTSGKTLAINESCTLVVAMNPLRPVSGASVNESFAYTSNASAYHTNDVTITWSSYSGPEWTWMNGSSSNGTPVWGIKGVAATSNIPGGRAYAASAQDSQGNFWVFGGQAQYSSDPNNIVYYANDLWKYNPHTNEWTWVSGSNTADAYYGYGIAGNFGTKGVASTSVYPGGRTNAAMWIDSNNIWIFGGAGCANSSAANNCQGTVNASLNDLWKFNPTTNEWTWVSGESDYANQYGVYGTKGVAAAANTTSARYVGVYWMDKNNNLWLYGGNGYNESMPVSAFTYGQLGDLWKFDANVGQWVWVSGSSSGFNNDNPPANAAPAIYGTKGIPSLTNTPGGISSGETSWVDESGNFWLFEGAGLGYYNELWSYNPTSGEWTWMSGSQTKNQNGVYGTKGQYSVTNTPGSRSEQALATFVVNGNLLMYGGYGYPATGGQASLGDLWSYNITQDQWMWLSGDNTPNPSASYGTMGTSSPTDYPGSRVQMPNSWVDGSGNFWIFGGQDAAYHYKNDIWVYGPSR